MDLLNKEDIIDYLGFLETRATELASKERTKEDDFCIINLEVNIFLERLKESNFDDQEFMHDVDSLKFSVDETKNTNRHWLLYTMIYGVLRWFPGMLVVHLKENADSKKRKEKLAEFKSQVGQLQADLDRYDVFTDV